MTHILGRNPIGVAQGPGQGGELYPLLRDSGEIRRLLADAYLIYRDDTSQLVPPFRISYLYGFGTQTVSVPIAPVNAHEAGIVDSLGATVFDSLNAINYRSYAYHDRLQIVEWFDEDQLLRLVVHTDWGPQDVTTDYDEYIEPDNAWLDPRTINQLSRRLRSVTVGPTEISDSFVLAPGFNTTIQSELAEVAPHIVGGHVLLSAQAGSGQGRFGGCEDTASPVLKSIGQARPNDRGDINIVGDACMRISPPVEYDSLSEDIPFATMDAAELVFQDFCEVCAGCDKFISVWEALRKVRNRQAGQVERLKRARDAYHRSRERILDNQKCRLDGKLRALIQPTCPDTVNVAVGYCNNDSECLRNLVLHISFAYTDGAGCTTNDSNIGGDPAPLVAETNALFSKLLCNTTFRFGNVDPDSNKGTSGGLGRPVRQFYRLGGTWPHYWAYWDAVEPGGMAAVTFQLEFTLPNSSERIELVADAYSVEDPVVFSGSSPVPGYVPGAGPVATPPGLRLTNCPIFVSASLSPDCCPDDEGSVSE